MVCGDSGISSLNFLAQSRFNIHKIQAKGQFAIASGHQDSAIVYYFDTSKKKFKFCKRLEFTNIIVIHS